LACAQTRPPREYSGLMQIRREGTAQGPRVRRSKVM
jgi:hypothetical protein